MIKTPNTPSAAGRDGLGNDMSDRSTWTGGSESGETDTSIGHQHATWAQDPDDTEGVPTAVEVGRTGELETGTEFGLDPSDDKSM